MDHESDVRLVDPHAEGGRGNHDVDLAGHELLLNLLAYALREAGVVRGGPHVLPQELIRVLLGGLAGSNVDDARPGGRGDRLQHFLLLVGLIEAASNGQIDVLPRGAPHHDRGIMKLQPLEDVGTNRRSGRGGQRDDPRAVQALEKFAEAEVVRAEVMPPGRYAVRLVDGDQGRAHSVHGLAYLVVGQLLGSEEEEFDSAGCGVSQRLIPLSLGLSRADPPGDGPSAVLHQPAGLVFLQR